ncbi:unnamed protein product [Paramecium pentaurelia]|uniref:Uncharacterized protein n=1 Tax=Paramecium pentaurelia TaxID=43138 RepID=A0A8S1S3Q0_9CILI|nr:unnamed protein product [Paramecium pentaurelia]
MNESLSIEYPFRLGKRRTISSQLSNQKSKTKTLFTTKLEDVSIKNDKLKVILKQRIKSDFEQLKEQIDEVAKKEENKQIKVLALINGFTMASQKKGVFRYLESLKRLQMQKVVYYQISILPIDINLRAIAYFPQILNVNAVEELNIFINPKQHQNISYGKKNRMIPSETCNFSNLKSFCMTIQDQKFYEVEISLLSYILNYCSKSYKLEILKLNFGKCYFEKAEIFQQIVSKCFSCSKNLKILQLDVSSVNNFNKINFQTYELTQNIEQLQLNLANIPLTSQFFLSLLAMLGSMKFLQNLGLNFSKSNVDFRKLQFLLDTVMKIPLLNTFSLDLSSNIFCQSFNTKIYEENLTNKKQLKQLNLILNDTVCLSDQHTIPSPDFGILGNFTFKKLVLNLNSTIQTYNTLNIFGCELEQSNCSDITLKLNNTRLNYDHILFLQKALQNCRTILRLQLYVQNNLIQTNQMSLILAAFIQMKLMTMNIHFNEEIKSKLINDFAMNSTYLLKSNLVTKRIESLLNMKKLFVSVIIKLEKYNLEPEVLQFLNDLYQFQ